MTDTEVDRRNYWTEDTRCYTTKYAQLVHNINMQTNQ